jgi:hypothetical protein
MKAALVAGLAEGALPESNTPGEMDAHYRSAARRMGGKVALVMALKAFLPASPTASHCTTHIIGSFHRQLPQAASRQLPQAASRQLPQAASRQLPQAASRQLPQAASRQPSHALLVPYDGNGNPIWGSVWSSHSRSSLTEQLMYGCTCKREIHSIVRT